MSVIEEIQQLTEHQHWLGIVARADELCTLTGSNSERAQGLHALARAYWALSRNAFDLVAAVRYSRAAARLDHLRGRTLKTLGSFLITIGRYGEGTRVLNTWLARYHEWSPELQADLADVQYNLGYAARYQRQLDQAALWYSAALHTYTASGNARWVELTSCALAQVLARQGRPDVARQVLNKVSAQEAYRLKALTEIHVSERNYDAAFLTGESASAELAALEDADPWELADLHILLADVQMQVGNLVERDIHLGVVMDALRQSPRHDLYTAACLLLERDREEVV